MGTQTIKLRSNVASAIHSSASGKPSQRQLQLVKSTVKASALRAALSLCVMCFTVSPSTLLSSHPPLFSPTKTGGVKSSLGLQQLAVLLVHFASLSFGSPQHTKPCPAASNNTTRPHLPRPPANQLKTRSGINCKEVQQPPPSARLPTRQALSKMAWTKPSTSGGLLRHHRCPVLALLLCLYALVVESFMVPTHTKATTTRRPRVAGAAPNSRLIRGSTVRRFSECYSSVCLECD